MLSNPQQSTAIFKRVPHIMSIVNPVKDHLIFQLQNKDLISFNRAALTSLIATLFP